MPQLKFFSPNLGLTVMIPPTELIQTVNGVCLDNFGVQCQIITSPNANYSQLVLSNVCKNGCTAGQTIQIRVVSGFSNPAISKVPAVPYQV